MGSQSDCKTMQLSVKSSKKWELSLKLDISAHRTPKRTLNCNLCEKIIGVIIAGAGGSAHHGYDFSNYSFACPWGSYRAKNSKD